MIRRCEIKEITLISADEAMRLDKEILKSTGWWWTRTPGLFQDSVTYINGSGMMMKSGAQADDWAGGIRPVLVVTDMIEICAVVGTEIGVEDAGMGIYIGNGRILMKSVGCGSFDRKKGTDFGQASIKKWLAVWWKDLPAATRKRAKKWKDPEDESKS